MNTDKDTFIQDLKDRVEQFKNERDWGQFHNPKDVAEAIVVEAGELLELFLWHASADAFDKVKNDPEFRNEVTEELADIFKYCLSFANAAGIDIVSAIADKMEKDGKKYPVDKARGSAKKYTKL